MDEASTRPDLHFRNGIAWWAKPIERAIAANKRLHHMAHGSPAKEMTLASACSGMLPELVTKQAAGFHTHAIPSDPAYIRVVVLIVTW